MSIITLILTGLSLILLVISAMGLMRLPTPLARQHAATKAATLSLTLFIFALVWHAIDMGWSSDWLIKLSLLLLLLLITLPLASHALARSSLSETKPSKIQDKGSK